MNSVYKLYLAIGFLGAISFYIFSQGDTNIEKDTLSENKIIESTQGLEPQKTLYFLIKCKITTYVMITKE
ncbi:hypothetical protein [Brumicola pallidula]|jgi:hypothetical protein|uniref:Uncharacterized protein n=1 Tax=Brumicola pallidula DSM 14239 = ACAM 615 TaxID=1121922 RepID=K7A3P2_9ALTE|nr:hypothetical protein [Glaciecola pallidula]GAC30115.1 hypothetical protein GPAL_3264 [Glaciecola pallidula DSM 14239 = ACAM 615]